MSRTKGSKNKHPTTDCSVTIRIQEPLLSKIDTLARLHLQNRSEAILEAILDYVKKNSRELQEQIST